jgi:hypothetical protein
VPGDQLRGQRHEDGLHPFDEFLTGVALDTAAGGTAAVLPFATNFTPQFCLERIEPCEEDERISPEFLLVDRASANLRYSTMFRTVSARIFYRCACYLCFVRWNLQCTPLPVTPDR